MSDCPHTDTVPVEVRSRLDGGVEVVAHLCADCLAELPPNWGCPDCEWVETRRLCDPPNRPGLVLAQPCRRHDPRRTA